jgi:serine/threonine protein phosphatase PrpC
MTRFAAGAATDVGQVRTVNQDNTLVGDDVFAVADGMGGHRGGEVASAVAVDALRHHFRERTPLSLVEAVREANQAIVERSQGDPELRGMGTTLCALARARNDGGDEVLTIVNVGDSRAYLLKQGDVVLWQISEDHSLVQQLVRQGQLSPDAAAVHPQRNILTRALGIDRDVKPDAFVVMPVKGDRYLLCSDGLFNEVDETRIAQVLRQTSDPRKAAQVLVHLANEGGGRDNISVVVVDITDDGGRPRALEARADEHRIVDTVRFEDRPLGGGEPSDPTMIDAGYPNGDGQGGGDDVTATRPLPVTPGADAQSVRVNRAAGTGPAPALGTTRTPDGRVVVDPTLMPPGSMAEPEVPQMAPAPVVVRQPRTRFTWRVALFVLCFVGIFAGAIYAVNWVADNSWFVGTEGNQVAIFRGRPGGLLWRQPRVEQHAGFALDDVLTQFRPSVQAGTERTSLADAQAYLDLVKIPPTTTTTTTTTTSTTVVDGLSALTTTTVLGTGP